MAETLTLSTQANLDTSHAADVVRAVYRQVFGNYHLMEMDRNPSLEALFINGDLSVQGFVTGLAQSETYRRLFLYTNSPYRFVELNFKHLLGRPPHDQAEIMKHVKLLAEEGFDAEIASYTYSDEYLKHFNVDQVPYARTHTAKVGETTLSYTRAKALDPGYAGFDGGSAPLLLTSLTTASNPDFAGRKGVGGGGTFKINWQSGMQIGSSRRSVQRSVVAQTSLSATIQSIQAQGGSILSITTNTNF